MVQASRLLEKMKHHAVSFHVGLLVLAFSVGCGRGDLPRKVVYGNVTCGDAKVTMGMLRFAPIEPGVDLPSTSGRIVDGQYRIEQKGGVPLGKYRVEIDARRPTGTKTTNPLSGQTTEETVTMGPKIYAGVESPLTVEVTAAGDGRIDLAIP